MRQGITLDYIAGFFDGEGSVGIYRNGQRSWHLRTQLTQNIDRSTTALLSELRQRFGGNLATMRSPIYRASVAYNWQLNGAVAAAFLREVLPYLRLKREQADFAIAWQSIQQKASRDERGRNVAHDHDRPIDIGAARLLKALKRQDIDEVMAAQADLVDVVHELRQVVCVKG